MNYDLLQQHTVDIYHLKDFECQVKKVKARTLLKPQRFDLFAKLYYIENIHSNRELALSIYSSHIKAFNPDGREPGRDDKNDVADFITTFDKIISHFKENEFDDSVSIVPVDKHGVILDGGHRVAALAYYDRDVTIAQFDEVEAKCNFDFNYFKNRGLSWALCDEIAFEMIKWLDSVNAACLWPSINQDYRELVISKLSEKHEIAYIKSFKCDLQSMVNFVNYIYRDQEWTQNLSYVQDKAMRIYGKSQLVIAFFVANCGLEDMVREKTEIRNLIGKGKDSLHITDNKNEALDIASVTLKPEGIRLWLTSKALSFVNKISSSLKEQWLVFKKVKWINFKARVRDFIGKE